MPLVIDEWSLSVSFRAMGTSDFLSMSILLFFFQKKKKRMNREFNKTKNKLKAKKKHFFI
jgi:hypothetical protein